MRIIPLIIAGLILSTPARAQMMCASHDFVTDHLAKKYGEASTAFGITNMGALVEILVSDDNDGPNTWTIIVTSPQGTSCIVAAGEGWRGINNPPGPYLGPRT